MEVLPVREAVLVWVGQGVQADSPARLYVSSRHSLGCSGLSAPTAEPPAHVKPGGHWTGTFLFSASVGM